MTLTPDAPERRPCPRTIRRNVRIALVHDWLDTWRGGECVLAELCGIYREADLFSLVDFLPDADRAKLGGRRATTSFLHTLPFAGRGFRRWLPFFPRAIESLDVSGYDLVISISHAVAKGVRTHRRQLHLCYCLTPIRYAWDLRETYLEQAGLDRGVRGWIVRRSLDRIRTWDREVSARVDRFAAISRHIAARIERCYGRESTVIYPPVGNGRIDGLRTDETQSGASNPLRTTGDAYVTVSQLVPYKRVDLIVEAFRALPDRRLTVIGDGPERTRIAALAGPNVQMLGRIPDRERDDRLAGAAAFIFAAEEDFGIAPIEAQAFGTPVIALARGGAVETIRGLGDAGPTGVLYPDQTAPAIAEAVRTFEANRHRIDVTACIANARRFAPARFRSEFESFVEACWREFAAGRSA